VTTVDEVVRIRTSEQGNDALRTQRMRASLMIS
jgi:hypothetical protein